MAPSATSSAATGTSPATSTPAAALPVWPLPRSRPLPLHRSQPRRRPEPSPSLSSPVSSSSPISLLRRWQLLSSGRRRTETSLAPAIAVLLLAVSPFCYVFTRMAILEPLLILFTLLALLTASYIRPWGQESPMPRKYPLLPTPLLPTSLSFLRPSSFPSHGPHQDHRHLSSFPRSSGCYGLAPGYRLPPPSFVSAFPAAPPLAAVIWLSYYLFVVPPRIFLSRLPLPLRGQRLHTGLTPSNILSVLADTIADGPLDRQDPLPPSPLLAAISVFLLRPPPPAQTRSSPPSLLWAGGYASLSRLPQTISSPRYYLVIRDPPLTLLVPIVFSTLWTSGPRTPHRHRKPICTASPSPPLRPSSPCSPSPTARQTLHYVPHPRLHFHQCRRTDPPDHLRRSHSQTLSSSPSAASQLSLMTGLPSICDDFGTMDLPVRIKGLPPRLVRHLEPGRRRQDGRPHPHVSPPARRRLFPAMDDPERKPPHPLSPRSPHHPASPRAATRKPVIPPPASRPASASSPAPPQLIH